MMRAAGMIFRKELVHTLRDRKTLIFMALIPTLAVPLLLIGINKLMQGAIRKQAAQMITLAVDEDTRDRYRRWVHEWMLETDVADGLRVATSPIMKALLEPGKRGGVVDIPADILTNPIAFEEWVHSLAGAIREGIDAPNARDEHPDIELPDELLEEVVAFHEVAIKGLALVEFVDVGELAEPNEPVDSESIPESLRSLPNVERIVAAIRAKSIDGFLSIPGALDRENHDGRSFVEVVCAYDSTISLSREVHKRIDAVMEEINNRFVKKRLADVGLGEHFLEPVQLKEETDVASKATIALARIGDVLPTIVFLFAFLGGLYPAIDLGAGEKEHNTLESLLLTPVSRTQIAVGKFLVILLASLVAALLGVVSIALSIKHILAPELLEYLNFRVDPWTAMLVALLVIPPAAAFSGIFLAISIYARTFKEAQNYLAPLQFVIFIPALAPLIPGVEMDWKLAFIPLVNVSMISKDFLKGETHWGYYAATLGSCALLAAACIWYAVRQFKNESVLFRS